MKLSDEVLKELAKIIIKDMDVVRGFGDREAIDRVTTFLFNMEEKEELLFNFSTEPVECMTGLLSRYNNTGKIKAFIENFLKPKIKKRSMSVFNITHGVTNKIKLAGEFRTHLEKDGYQFVVEKKTIIGASIDGFYFRIVDEDEFAETPAIEENEEVKEVIETAKERFTKDDYKGAITSSFTLAETVIKNILDEMDVKYKPTARFIDLYPVLYKTLNLNPAGKNIESRLKPVLQGLKNQVDGLYHLANKASDRHAPEYIPKRQDAKLAMNAAFTLCEYLRETLNDRLAEQEQATSKTY